MFKTCVLHFYMFITFDHFCQYTLHNDEIKRGATTILTKTILFIKKHFAYQILLDWKTYTYLNHN